MAPRSVRTLGLCMALFLFICSDIRAADTDQPEQSETKFTTWQRIGFGGLLSAVHAGIAAFDPTVTGALDVCVPPYLGVHGALRAKHMWPAAIAFSGLGVYNLTVDEDRVSRGRIFAVNFVGMSAAMIASALIYDPEQTRKKQEDRLQAGLSLGRHASMLALSYSF